MIRIQRSDKAPETLITKGTAQTRKDCASHDCHPGDYRSGSKKFSFDKNIYDTVKDMLLEAQHQKCCYCESKGNATSYGEIEHFRPKGGVKQKQGQSLQYPGYYWLAYDWDNLLVSCKRCNPSHKGNLFPLAVQKRRARSHHDDVNAEQPLFINPAREDPRRHIRFRGEVAIHRTKRGRETINGLGLRRPDLEEERRERLDYLKRLRDIVELGTNSIDPEAQSQAEDARKHLAAAVLPDAKYSAMARDFLCTETSSTKNE